MAGSSSRVLFRLTPLACAGLLAAARLLASPVELLSPAVSGTPRAVGIADEASVSSDGRYVAFASTSPNLVAGQNDGNNGDDVFLWDWVEGTTILVSHRLGSALHTGDGASTTPKVSADGNWVAFVSSARSLVAGQVDPSELTSDVFLWERSTGVTTLVSHTPAGANVAGGCCISGFLEISADGTYVAFAAATTNLVPGQQDTNSARDVFLYDRATGTIALVSHASGAATVAGNSSSEHPSLSADGRYVAYLSRASDLVAAQSESALRDDVFLYDRATGSSVLVSHASGSATTAGNAFSRAPRVSADGSFVVFSSQASDLAAGQSDVSIDDDVFLYDVAAGTATLVSHLNGASATAGNAASWAPSISIDGAYLAYASLATDLVAGLSDANGTWDVFLYDRAADSSVLVSGASGSASTTANDASTDPRLSADGGRVAFMTLATDLLAGASDTNGVDDVYLYTRSPAGLELVSHEKLVAIQAEPPLPAVTGNGVSFAPAPSATGAYVAFVSRATDLTPQGDSNDGPDVFLYPGAGSDILPVSFSPAVISATANGMSAAARVLSADGRYAVFISNATDLVAGMTDANAEDSDVYLRDRTAGTTVLVSRSAASPTTTGNNSSQNMVLSAGGGFVAFESLASDLVPGQNDPGPPFGDFDVFLFDRAAGTTTLVSRLPGSATQSAQGMSTAPAISGDGAYVVFTNAWGTPVAGLTDGNAAADLFLYSRASGTSVLVSRTSASPTTTGDGASENAVIDITGRYVAFLSKALNLVVGQATNNSDYNVFLFDRVAGTTTLVSHASGAPAATGDAGTPNAFFGYAPAISAGGAFVAFISRATDLVAGQADAAGTDDVFLWERATGAVTLVSRAANAATKVGNGHCELPSISADGRFVAFTSVATDLVPGQVDGAGTADVFLYDRTTGGTTLVSHVHGSATTTPGVWSPRGVVSADGTAVVFESPGASLAAGQADANGNTDVFLYDRVSKSTRLVSHADGAPRTAGNSFSVAASISADGGAVLFTSAASDLVDGDHNVNWDVFAHPRPGLDFFALAPCRLLDTRTPADAPALASGTTRVLPLAGKCGIPATAQALALNVTVTEGSGPGHLSFHAGDAPTPATSTINFAAGQTRANNAVLPLAFDGSGTLAASPFVLGGGTVHAVLDVVGYFE